MYRVIDKTICDRCGEEIYKRSISIDNLYKYDTSNKDTYIKSIIETECVSKEVATSWANHGLFEMCTEKVAYCQKCNNQLKTWHSKKCLKCGESI